jgi:hypothetical protein
MLEISVAAVVDEAFRLLSQGKSGGQNSPRTEGAHG